MNFVCCFNHITTFILPCISPIEYPIYYLLWTYQRLYVIHMCPYMCVYIQMCICVYTCLYNSILSLYIHVCMYIFIYKYIFKERCVYIYMEGIVYMSWKKFLNLAYWYKPLIRMVWLNYPCQVYHLLFSPAVSMCNCMVLRTWMTHYKASWKNKGQMCFYVFFEGC